jgi:hypothetical protein
MVMALYAIAELIEARSVDRARRAIASLLALAPDTAEVRQAGGGWAEVPADQVPLDAVVRVRPGCRIPLDGLVTAGASAVDQAPVTGESIPVEKAVGDPVFAGTISQAGLLELRVTAAASNTTLARIVHAVEQAQGARAPTQRFVDRFAAIYTPAVFVFAVAFAVFAPLGMGWSWTQALYQALVLLVIACPCALVIATPVTVVSGLGGGGAPGHPDQGRRLPGRRPQAAGHRAGQDRDHHRGQAATGRQPVSAIAPRRGSGARLGGGPGRALGPSGGPGDRERTRALWAGGGCAHRGAGTRRRGPHRRTAADAWQPSPDRGARPVRPRHRDPSGRPRIPGIERHTVGLRGHRARPLRRGRHDQASAPARPLLSCTDWVSPP